MTILCQIGTGENRNAFTFFELLFVLAVVTALAIFLLPVVAKARDRSASFTALCLNNHRQLIAAAIMYADDNQDNWLPNQPGERPEWCPLIMNFNVANTDNTNIFALKNPAICTIAPFIQNPKVFRCPADQSYVAGEGIRVRSTAMNGAVGTVGSSTGPLVAGQSVNGQWLTGVNIGFLPQTQWRTYGKTSQMTAPTPANLWVFCDEHPDSIDGSSFAVQVAFTGPFATIIDYPASYHEGTDVFSFADGHDELHKWVGQTIQPAIILNNGDPIGDHSTPASDSAADILWLQQRTSTHL